MTHLIVSHGPQGRRIGLILECDGCGDCQGTVHETEPDRLFADRIRARIEVRTHHGWTQCSILWPNQDLGRLEPHCVDLCAECRRPKPVSAR